jgi:hypothetical protein
LGSIIENAEEVAADWQANWRKYVVLVCIVSSVVCPPTWWLATMVAGHKYEAQLASSLDRATSIALEVKSPPGPVEIMLNDGPVKLSDGDTGFVRFYGVARGRHLVRYSYRGYERGRAFIDVGEKAGGYFQLPPLTIASDGNATKSRELPPVPLAAVSPPAGSATEIRSSLPSPSDPTQVNRERCCWIFLGTFVQRLRKAEAKPDTTITVESGLPLSGGIYILKTDVIMRERVDGAGQQAGLTSAKYQGNQGVLKSGSVVKLIEVDGSPQGYYPFWARVETFNESRQGR